jgi:hypothetical protein
MIEQYPLQFLDNGTETGFYSTGIIKTDITTSDGFLAYSLLQGEAVLIESDNHDEPPYYEVTEFEEIIIRPILKYPKRSSIKAKTNPVRERVGNGKY